MKKLETNTFTLGNFEGPLDFLLHLIQKNEIEITDISLRQITEQFLQQWESEQESHLDSGAEFVGAAASLIALKSKSLLPKHEQLQNPEDLEPDPRFEIIHQLLDYCRFKQAAKELAHREQQQSAFYFRGNDLPVDPRKNLGIEHLSLEDLADLFKQVMSKSIAQKGCVHDEAWKVSDKILHIRDLIKDLKDIIFSALFSPAMGRTELIVTFLAVLELMKLGELRVIKDLATQQVIIVSSKKL